jgi:hypothetical protein
VLLRSPTGSLFFCLTVFRSPRPPPVHDSTPLDPIFKFDRKTGAVLANFGKGVMVTPHGIAVDKQGNVWIADFAGNKAGTKGHRAGGQTQKLPTVGKFHCVPLNHSAMKVRSISQP